MKTNENGRSMIEMLGVLAIIGVLSVGGIAGYSKAMSKYRTNKAIDQATMLITNIRTMFAQQQTYKGLSNERAVDLGLVPEEMIGGTISNSDTGQTVKLRNVFGGDVSVKSSPIDEDDKTSGSGSNTSGGSGDTPQAGGSATDDDDNGPGTGSGAFVVTFKGLSRDACIQMATSDWGAGSSSGLIGMQMASEEGSPASYDKDKIDIVYKNGIGGQLDAGDSEPHIAIPGASKYKVPFTVVQAQAACDCKAQTACVVEWKYF